MNPDSSVSSTASAISPVAGQTGERKNPGRNYRKENTVSHGVNKLTNVERCVLCGAETQLYNNGQPMCPKCCDSLEAGTDVW